jgi:hypothetical protein
MIGLELWFWGERPHRQSAISITSYQGFGIWDLI